MHKNKIKQNNKKQHLTQMLRYKMNIHLKNKIIRISYN